MFQQHRPTTAHIHLGHLAHNTKALKKLAGAEAFFCPMIKANAYGHGDVDVALRLQQEGFNTLGVALIEEGTRLREGGVTGNIFHFGIFHDEAAARELVKNKLTPVLSTWDQIRVLESTLSSPWDVHVKFDTGMHRLGFSLEEIPALVEKLSSHPKIKVRGVLTHLHSGEDARDFNGNTFEQLRKFQAVEKAFAPMKVISHALNSSGFINFVKHKPSDLPEGISPRQGVRPGLSIYGYSPYAQPSFELKPVMSVRTKTVKYHRIPAGDGVSYGVTWKAPRESVIAVVPAGYADGYHRRLSNKGEVLFRGKRAPVVGNVCMDYFMIDVTQTLQSETVDSLGPEEVTLFGYDSNGILLSAAEVAQKASTVAWEILTSVGERVPRSKEG